LQFLAKFIKKLLNLKLMAIAGAAVRSATRKVTVQGGAKKRPL